jgi:lysophospholipase L1-like esterase
MTPTRFRRTVRSASTLRIIALLTVLLVGCVAAPPQSAPSVSSAAPASDQWEGEIAQFEAADRLNPPRENGAVFVGSSSIRLWPNLQADFPGVDVLQRGFGGSELADAVRYAPRIVLRYRPRLVVLYAGDNDLANGKSPETVFRDYKEFVSIVERALPRTRVAFISIKPSGSRWALVDKIRSANAMVREYAAHDPRQTYVDVFTPMLGANGLPRDELFVADKLHMTAQGYALWREILAPIIGRSFP